jgi:hypothetical protein
MKTFLLIWLISTFAGQAPVLERVEEPDMATCQQQAQLIRHQLGVPGNDAALDHPQPGRPLPYLVRTGCVVGR